MNQSFYGLPKTLNTPVSYGLPTYKYDTDTFGVFGNKQYPVSDFIVYTNSINAAFPVAVGSFWLYLVFTKVANVSVDYGDGRVDRYIGSSINVLYYSYGGIAKERTITISMDIPGELTLIEFQQLGSSINRKCGIIFSNYPKLSSLSCFNTNLYDFDESFYNSANKLTVLSLVLESTKISLDEKLVANKILTTFSIGGAGNLSDVNTNNIYYIPQYLKNTLTSLSLSNLKLNEYSLPESLSELIKLTSLGLSTNNFTVVPTVAALLPSLQTLNLTNNSLLVDISNLWSESSINYDKITTLSLLNTPSLPGAFYSDYISNPTLGFAKMTSIKTISRYVMYKLENNNTERSVDNFVNMMYEIVNSNASKSTGNTSFRQITVNIDTGPYGAASLEPLGIYQQPTGYVAGSDNGTPATPKEKIWVMVNQYAHNWVYNTNLKANYTFSGNANDTVSASNNLTVSGATLTIDRFDNVNSAYLFNGTTNYLVHTTQIPLFVNGLSISLWAKFDNITSTSYMIGGSTASDGVRYNGATFLAILGGITFTSSTWTVAGSTGNINGWTHLVVVQTGPFSVDFYVNGLKLGNTVTTTSSVSGVNIKYIGRRSDGFYFNGPIDDVRIYNAAITTGEITALYNNNPII